MTFLESKNAFFGGPFWNHLNGLFGASISSLNTKALLRDGIKCPEKPIQMFLAGTLKKGIF